MQDVHELEQEGLLRRQRREWSIQRLGWLVMALCVAAGVLGLLGGGGLFGERVTGEKGAPIWIEHERLARLETPTTLRVHLLPGQPDGEVSFWVATEFLEHVEVRQIMPPPESTRVDADRLVYTFDAAAGGRPLVVALTVQPDDPGLLRGAFGRLDGPSVRLTQMVVP